MPYAPASNPFVVTVGAVDIGGSLRTWDDARAPWSAYGRTPDGFLKPEICAPGRHMVGPIPMGSTLAWTEGGQAGRGRLHPALRNLVRGAGDLGPRGSGPGAEPELDARSGQERTDAACPSGPAVLAEVVRCRPGERGADGARHDRHVRTRTRPSTGSSGRSRTGRRCSTPSPGRTSRGATSPGTRSRGATSRGATSPGTRSPGATSPGRTCPGAMSPGRMSPGRTTRTVRRRGTGTATS